MKRPIVVWVVITGISAAMYSFSQSSTPPQSLAPDFVMDSAVLTQPEELRRDAESLNNAQCNGHYTYLERPTTIGEFMGGTAKIVRITRYTPTIGSPAETKVRQILTKVWSGQFKSASCQIDWAEGTFWSVEGVIEFQDGKRGMLVADGFNHIALQDHAGKDSFIRLDELPHTRA